MLWICLAVALLGSAGLTWALGAPLLVWAVLLGLATIFVSWLIFVSAELGKHTD